MLNSVDFVSDIGFNNFKPAPNLGVISIGDPGSAKPKSLIDHERANSGRVLRVEFIDLELEDIERYGLSTDQLCSRSQIKAMVEHINRLHEHRDLMRLIVHCRMGLSRSASVALIAHLITGCWFPRFAQTKTANRNILKLAGEVLDIPVVYPRTDMQVSKEAADTSKSMI